MCDAEMAGVQACDRNPARSEAPDELDDAGAFFCVQSPREEMLLVEDEKSCSATCSSNSDVDDDSSISLVNLPVEIFLHICSFLDASTLVHRLSLTCKQFHMILSDDSIWKVRISKVWPSASYPILPCVDEDELFWKLSCVAIERQANLWKNKDTVMEKISLSGVHGSPIDGLKLMYDGKICISGGRDRSLVMCKLAENVDDVDKIPVTNAHDGWIFGLTDIHDTVFSCGWDSSVKAWAIHNTGIHALCTYDMTVVGALLCITSSSELGLFATGSYYRSVVLFDSRNSHAPVAKYIPHQRAVIRMAMNSSYIISASEDKTVNVWDLRTRRSLKSIMISKDSFPMSLCIHKDLVYVGDSCANLHVLDAKKDFELVKSYKTEHEKKITGVHVDAGCLITSSLDKSVRIFSPTNPPQPMTSLQYNGEVARIDYQNEVLALSGSDTIEIWRPKART